MKTLYFHSINDGLIRHASIKDLSSVISIVNQNRDQTFLKFLMFKTSIADPVHLYNCQNKISKKDISKILHYVGEFDKRVRNGRELSKLLLHKPDNLDKVFMMAQYNKLIANYLNWIFGNYIKLFNNHYGELIMIVSKYDDIKLLPDKFSPITYKTDTRVFYTMHDGAKTREICEACAIKIKNGKILTLYPNTFFIASLQLLLQGADLMGGSMIY